MTDWPATVARKWAIARNHAATVEEYAIREAPVVRTGEARRVGGRPSLTPQLSSLL